jgi:NADH:ubiquinone oxidoreductase subunit C
MNNEALKAELVALFPDAVVEEGLQWVTISIDAYSWKATARQLRTSPQLDFDFLFCLTCVDWKTLLTMVYHLTSTQHRHTLVVKSNLNREHPEIETVSDIWLTAEFHEREVFDLFGVTFKDHPDLRRLFMTDEYEGWPLRKDFEDAINMIKL